MAASVSALLTNALSLAGLADTEFSPVEPSGSQINVALNYFTQILDTYRDEVPFWDEKFLEGEDELKNIGASAINFVEYLIDSTFFGLKACTQKEFADVESILNLRAIPEWYWFDEGNQELRVYPLPDQSGRRFLIGFRPLPEAISLKEALPKSVKPFMQLFLQYEVASVLTDHYKLPWTQKQDQKRLEYLQKLHDNTENAPSVPRHRSLKAPTYPVPSLAYISGNTPGTF